MAAGSIAKLVDDYKAISNATDAEVAERVGISRQSLHLWRASGRKSPPEPENLRSFALVIGVPYRRVLDAALADAGYLDDGAEDAIGRLTHSDIVDITNIVTGTVARTLTAKESARLRVACAGGGKTLTLSSIAVALSAPER